MNQKLLQKLKAKIRLLSVNSTGNIYPDDLMEWLEISDMELKEFVEDLNKERVLVYKYRFVCECDELCVVYQNKLESIGFFNCPVCGKKFTIKEISRRAEILYEIDKQELLELGMEVIDFRKEAIQQTKKSLNDKETNKNKQEIKSMEIFLGSSSESKNFMEVIALRLQELDQDTLMWSDTGKGIFAPGTTTIDALIEITKRVQAAVFIFSADDKVWNDSSSLEENNVVRDNVLFEYGLFAGALGKENVCFVCKGKPKLASDLKGITYIDGDLRDMLVKNKLKDWLMKMGVI